MESSPWQLINLISCMHLEHRGAPLLRLVKLALNRKSRPLEQDRGFPRQAHFRQTVPPTWSRFPSEQVIDFFVWSGLNGCIGLQERRKAQRDTDSGAINGKDRAFLLNPVKPGKGK